MRDDTVQSDGVQPNLELDQRFDDGVVAKAFVRTLHANLNNDKLTDAEFRQFVRNCLTPNAK